MNANEIEITKTNHLKWLRGEPSGVRADLSDADLSRANLSRADLSDANLSDADLIGANLSGANLSRANLSDADLIGANLSGANLSWANLRRANLSRADPIGANLSWANLSWANLSWANLSRANLSGADLSGANLSDANLSWAKGILSAIDFMAKFESDADGVIVYKRIGATEFTAPAHWRIESGAILTEICNPDRGTACGCGVNFGTREWCAKKYGEAVLWRCRIRWIDLAGVVVPFATDGKARCEKLELIEVME